MKLLRPLARAVLIKSASEVSSMLALISLARYAAGPAARVRAGSTTWLGLPHRAAGNILNLTEKK